MCSEHILTKLMTLLVAKTKMKRYECLCAENVVHECQLQVGCGDLTGGTGQCMFDLTCRLSYGHKVGDCSGGFYQVNHTRLCLHSHGL